MCSESEFLGVMNSRPFAWASYEVERDNIKYLNDNGLHILVTDLCFNIRLSDTPATVID